MRVRKKPVEVEAVRWWEHGDHPMVERDSPSRWTCSLDGKGSYEHGSIRTLEGRHIVCPGDWIITGVKGEHYPCKPDVFEATYEPVSASGEIR